MKPIRLPALLLAIAACALPASAQTTVNLSPAADSYVNQTSPSTNYGTSDIVSIRHTSGNNRRLAYLKFDLGDSLADPIASVSLSLSFAYHSAETRTDSTIEVYGLSFAAYSPGEGQQPYDWDEATLVNNNAPWSATTQNAPAFVTLLGSFTIPGVAPSGGTVFTLSDNPAFVNFLESIRTNENTSVVTLILKETVGQAAATNFYSSDYANAAHHPLLSVTTAIPEPSTTIALFGCAALACAAARRTRASR